MRVALLPLGLCATFGCVEEERIAEEMRNALVSANEAVAVSIVAVEPGAYVVDPLAQLEDGYRHPSSICPSNEHDTSDPVTFQAELDYGLVGCVPRSGLVPTSVAGVGAIAVSGSEWDAAYAGLSLASANPVVGVSAGTVQIVGDEERLDFAGELRIDHEDGRQLPATYEIFAQLGLDGVSLGGHLLVSGIPVTLSELVLPFRGIRGDCPTPVSGLATVTGPSTELVVDFSDPGDGRVVVTRGVRTSDPTGWCNFESWVFIP